MRFFYSTLLIAAMIGSVLADSTVANAQIKTETESSSVDCSHQIGLGVSGLSGNGINYQFLYGPIGLKASGLIMYDESTDIQEFDYMYGLELQYAFVRGEVFRLYGLVAAHQLTETNEWTLPPFNGDPSPEFNRREETFTSGAGLGIEFLIWEHLATNFDFGVAYTNRDGGSFKSVMPAASIGIGFRF